MYTPCNARGAACFSFDWCPGGRFGAEQNCHLEVARHDRTSAAAFRDCALNRASGAATQGGGTAGCGGCGNEQKADDAFELSMVASTG